MSIPAASWNRVAGPLQQLLPASLAQTNIGDKLFKGAGVLNAGSAADLYLKLVSQWDNPTTLVLGAVEPQTVVTDSSQHPDISDFVSSMMALDLMTYLPDDILVKVDRAAMGVSLETRVPFLDHRLVEFAWSLPLSYKLRDGVGKWPLRQVLYRHVPRSLIERPKMGFGVPIGPWLRGPLRNWAEDLLAEPRLRQDGFFDPSLVRQKWEEHLSGKRDWQYHLWNVLAFQAWYAETR
jgi:asparagine synthase (glutamine-hydrolysing)